jgi:glycosyltransferase involved in cell wall biosynthesis
MARILLLSDIDSSHTRKWAVSLANRGHAIAVFSLRRSESEWYKKYPELRVIDAEGYATGKFYARSFSKLSYLRFVPALRAAIQEFKPDVVHAHYATSYGLLGVRSKFHPLVISVWGSDIFEFPKSSWLNRRLVTYNLNRADRILSTSHVMKDEVLKYVQRKVEVTPFGVDTEQFSPKAVPHIFAPGTKVIGIIKSLEENYGIDVLLRAFALVKKEFTTSPVKLLIAGDGSRAQAYRDLSDTLDLADDVVFTGRLPQEEIATVHNQLDIFVSLSVFESFGVSLVEAMACEKPAVVTAVGGLKEVAVENETALFVPPRDDRKTADAILQLLRNSDQAKQFGEAGRRRVLSLYDWQKNLDQIEAIYSDLLRKK